MQNRTKVILLNLLKTPIVVCVYAPIYFLYCLANAYVGFFENFGYKLQILEDIPPTNKQAELMAAKKEARKQEVISRLKGSQFGQNHALKE